MSSHLLAVVEIPLWGTESLRESVKNRPEGFRSFFSRCVERKDRINRGKKVVTWEWEVWKWVFRGGYPSGGFTGFDLTQGDDMCACLDSRKRSLWKQKLLSSKLLIEVGMIWYSRDFYGKKTRGHRGPGWFQRPCLIYKLLLENLLMYLITYSLLPL